MKDSVAKLELEEEGLWNQPEEFYWGDRYRNNYYIFPIAIDRDGQLVGKEDEEKKSDDSGLWLSWAEPAERSAEETLREQKFLAQYVLTEADVVELPELQCQWPTKIEKRISARFYDYGNALDGAEAPFACKAMHWTTWKARTFRGFGTKRLGLNNHNGSDITTGGGGGTSIYAVAAGKISGVGAFYPNGSYSGYHGNYIGHRLFIDHGNGIETMYAHMSPNYELTLQRDKKHGENPQGIVTCVYKAGTLQSVDGQSISKELEKIYPLIGVSVDTDEPIGVSATIEELNSAERIRLAKEEPPKASLSYPHLHLEIRYHSGQGLYYLNPEYFFKENKIDFSY